MIYDFLLRIIEFLVFHDLRKLRRELLSHTTGRVLEIGAGTGQNFLFYPQSVKLTTIQPEPDRVPQKRQLALGGLEMLSGSAEQLPFEDASFDFVVGTLVLCSIPNPSIAMAEIHRVLKPGGRFLTLEHVRYEGIKGRIQDWVTPCWKQIAGGCHLNRSLEILIAKTTFKVVNRQVIWNGLGRYAILEK